MLSHNNLHTGIIFVREATWCWKIGGFECALELKRVDAKVCCVCVFNLLMSRICSIVLNGLTVKWCKLLSSKHFRVVICLACIVLLKYDLS